MKIHTGEKKTKKSKRSDTGNKGDKQSKVTRSPMNGRDRSINFASSFLFKFKSLQNETKGQSQRHSKSEFNNSTNSVTSNQQDALLNMNQNQSVMDRLLPTMHSSLINSFNRNDDNTSIKSNQLNNGHSPINFSNSAGAAAASSSNWSNLTNNLANNLTSNLTNNLINNSTSNNKTYDNFANLAGYNTLTQQQMNLLLNQNGKHSPIHNLSMQQQQQFNLNQISNNYNGVDFPLLQ